MRPVRAARSGWASFPSFTPLPSAISRMAASNDGASQSARALNLSMRGGEKAASFGRKQRRSRFVDLERPLGKEEAGAVGELVQRMRAGLEFGHCAGEKRFLRVRSAELGHDELREPPVVRLANIVAVQILQFLEVEA